MSSNKKETNSFVFAVVMCLVCGFLLTFASVGLKDRQTQNKIVDQQKNILKSLGLLPESKLSNADLQSLFSSKVKQYVVNADGELVQESTGNDLKVYVIKSGEKISKYAIPFKAYGLWSWIYGYIAIEGDGNTVAGLTVYSHGETPGLGGECEKPWFQNQFVGKKITDKNGNFTSIGVVKGKVKEFIPNDDQDRYVDGISGSTITGKGIETYLKQELSKYEPFSQKLRQLYSRG
jgi:Na+-transporting NADH:ubiquinone oxidoreductase subunit C